MRLLVDGQLPPALARLLAGKGHRAEHVGDIGMQAASDAAIWDHALANDAIVITGDEDFQQRRALGGQGPATVWVKVSNTRRRELLAWFEGLLPGIVAALERGERLIEVV